MIRLSRPPVPPSLDLKNAQSRGAKEKAVFVENFENQGKLPETKDYNAYTGEDVREALTLMSHGKCAYCESTVSGSSQTDVEHYRPKGGVRDADDAGLVHPGYWWLAMDWDNLLLSCMHCNQSRRQLILDEDMTAEQRRQAILNNDLITTGKKNSFPTGNGHWVTSHLEDVYTEEKPLLIDPVRIDPELLFEWKINEDITTIKARDKNPRAAATIRILGLNRRFLTEDRFKTSAVMRAQADALRGTIDDMIYAASDEAAQAYKKSALRMLTVLAAFTNEKNAFAGMARAFFKELRDVVAEALEPNGQR